jgi:uncharacterized protein
MKFIIDKMLGTLAKWLRIMGFDTIYAKDMNNDEILLISEQDGRLLLSRDKELCERRASSMLIETTELDAQISQVIKSYPINPDIILSRCLECNSLLDNASKTEATGKVPEAVIERHDEFWHCPKCSKYYWAGSHWANMKKKADKYIL